MNILHVLAAAAILHSHGYAAGNNFGNAGRAEVNEKTEIKIISFNILTANLNPNPEPWEKRREACFNMIKTEKPDLMGLQEPIRLQMADLEERLSEEYGFIKIENHPYGLHNVIMYKKDKYELLDNGIYWLRPNSDTRGYSEEWGDSKQQRSAIWAHLKDKATGKEFFFFCTHQSLVPMARLEGAKLNVEMMKQIAGTTMPIFLVGDMNASNVATDSRKAQLAPYNEWMFDAQDRSPVTDNRYSYNQLGGGKPLEQWRIDIIFYRRVKPLKYETLDGEGYGVKYISDHYPVAFTCEF